MKALKNYLKGMLPEVVCLCMGMVVLLQYWHQQSFFREHQATKAEGGVHIPNPSVNTYLSKYKIEIEKAADKFYSYYK